MPHDEHACSVSLPTWSSVVGYEEGNPAVTAALKCGYPRFVYHPYVIELMDKVLEMSSASASERGGEEAEQRDCLVLPTAAAALRCRNFLRRAIEDDATATDNALLEDADDVDLPALYDASAKFSGSGSRVRAATICPGLAYAVLFPAQTVAGMEAKAYWQHTGEVVSSRRAETALLRLGVPVDGRCRVTCGNNPCVRTPHHTGGGDGGCDGPCGGTGGKEGEQQQATTAASTAVRGRINATNTVHDDLRERIAGWAKVPSKDHVALVPSGMASMYACLRSSRRYQILHSQQQQQQRRPSHAGGGGGTSIVFGFPYLDTLKLCSRIEFCPDGTEFFGFGDDEDMRTLEHMLESSKKRTGYCALFTEVPSNPLLQCPDLHRLRELADRYDFSLIVDDTISNFLNVDLIQSGLADAVCSSLTKLVSGRGDVIGGSVVFNPNTPRGRWLQRDYVEHFDGRHGGLFDADASALLRNSEDFAERNARINATAEGLADWLEAHPDVRRVYYPKNSPQYERLRTQRGDSQSSGGGGYGGLLSLMLDSHVCQRTFYDALDVAKGPSLGTDFTLVCPYTLLAHYHELDFALQYNVPPNLLRVAVGLESLESLQAKFQAALDASRLYPKVCMKGGNGKEKAAEATRSYSTQSISSRQRHCPLQPAAPPRSVALQRLLPTLVLR